MILDDVYKLADDLGLEVDKLKLDGQWHRVPVIGKKKSNKSGSFCLSEITLKSGDTVVVGLLCNWSSGREERLTLDDVVGATSDEIDEARRRARAAAEAGKKEKEKLQTETAKRAEEIWNRLPESGMSHYLGNKKVLNYDVRFSRGSIVVPARDVDGKLWTLQYINAEGEKKFLTGGAKRGRFHFIKCPAGTHYCFGVAEGYATAASLFDAMAQRFSIAVAFDAGNLLPVGEALRSRYPDSRIIFFADHDIYKGYPQALIRARDASPAVREQIARLARVRPDVAVEVVADDDARLTDRDKHFNTGVTRALLAAAAVDGDVVIPRFDKEAGQ